jgi:hypothetical protein
MSKTAFRQYIYLIIFCVQVLPVFLLATDYAPLNKHATEYNSKFDNCVEERMNILTKKKNTEEVKVQFSELTQSQLEEIKADSVFYCENEYSYLLFKSNKSNQNLVFKCIIIAIVGLFISSRFLVIRNRVKDKQGMRHLLTMVSLSVVIVGFTLNVWMILF